MIETFLNQLKENYESLTDGQKKVAKYFFEKHKSIAFMPAFEIGKEVNVSESTVIRLAQKLGYKGYADLQEMIQKEVTTDRILSQHEEISSIKEEQSLFKMLIAQDLANIQKMMSDLDEAMLEKAVNMISEAKNIYIIGNLSTYGIADFFAQWMNMVLRNTQLLVYEDRNYYTNLAKMNEETVLIPIIFPRYMKSTMETVKYARNKGTKIISITDSQLSPVYPYSDAILISPIRSNINIDSYTATLSLLTSMMRAVSIKLKVKVKDNLKEIEQVYKDNGVFFSK